MWYFGYEEYGFEGEGPNVFMLHSYSQDERFIGHLAEAHPEVIYFEAEIVPS